MVAHPRGWSGTRRELRALLRPPRGGTRAAPEFTDGSEEPLSLVGVKGGGGEGGGVSVELAILTPLCRAAVDRQRVAAVVAMVANNAGGEDGDGEVELIGQAVDVSGSGERGCIGHDGECGEDVP